MVLEGADDVAGCVLRAHRPLFVLWKDHWRPAGRHRSAFRRGRQLQRQRKYNKPNNGL